MTRVTVSRPVNTTEEVEVELPMARRVSHNDGSTLAYYCAGEDGWLTDAVVDFDVNSEIQDISISTQRMSLSKSVSKILALDAGSERCTPISRETFDEVLVGLVERSGASSGTRSRQAPSLPSLQDLIETQLPGWGWLVRNAGSIKEKHGKYFANITPPGFESVRGRDHCFPEWADTPEDALSRSLDRALEYSASKVVPIGSEEDRVEAS